MITHITTTHSPSHWLMPCHPRSLSKRNSNESTPSTYDVIYTFIKRVCMGLLFRILMNNDIAVVYMLINSNQLHESITYGFILAVVFVISMLSVGYSSFAKLHRHSCIFEVNGNIPHGNLLLIMVANDATDPHKLLNLLNYIIKTSLCTNLSLMGISYVTMSNFYLTMHGTGTLGAGIS